MTAAQLALVPRKEEPVLGSQNQVQECLHAYRCGIKCYYSVAIFTLSSSECRQHPVCILCLLNPCESWSGNIIASDFPRGVTNMTHEKVAVCCPSQGRNAGGLLDKVTN